MKENVKAGDKIILFNHTKILDVLSVDYTKKKEKFITVSPEHSQGRWAEYVTSVQTLYTKEEHPEYFL